MNNLDFVNMHRYQDIEQEVYKKVKEWKPNTIVELGHGSGAVTVAMALALKDIGCNAKIYSYDIIDADKYYSCMGYDKYSHESAHSRVSSRGLSNIVEFIGGNIFETYVNNPFQFDLLVIDIDNTWPVIYDIVIKNDFIRKYILRGAKVLIEGGDPNHPRINTFTLSQFNKLKGKEIFKINHIAGSGRTSISKLDLV